MVSDVTLGITKKEGEYRVFWNEDRKDDEGKAYYTNDAYDAVLTMVSMEGEAIKMGKSVKFSDAKFTQSLLRKFDV